jgi:serine/threonine protein phosphatase PrpC
MFLSKAMVNAHHAILDYAAAHLNDEAPRTTCVTCLIQDGNAYWAHAGDSRLYLIRGGRVIAQTRDHSRVQLMLEQGLLDEREAATHPARNRIYSCLGGMHLPQIDFSQQTRIRGGDVVVLCSDGLWAPVSGEMLASRLSGADVMAIVPPLMEEADRAGGKHGDNLSIIAMTWEEGGVSSSKSVISTQQMPVEQVNSTLDGFLSSRDESIEGEHADLTEEDIDRVVAEIQSAIQKVSRASGNGEAR